MYYQYIFLKVFFLANEKYFNTLQWFATTFMAIAAIAITISIELSMQSYIFILFLISHMIWAFSANLMENKPLLTLNLAFIPLDIYGMLLRLQ